ncbi:MAG: malto-oligosyltrehalose trehalohydrolase [Candidatus Omnitrophota bacterium]
MRMPAWSLDLGADFSGRRGTSFKVWAPFCSRMEVKLLQNKHSRLVGMKKNAEDYFHARVKEARPGDLYFYQLNGQDDRPDPVSRFQPNGVHGPSCVVDPTSFRWTDRAWKGISLSEMIFYELHIGTFTPEGTFKAAIKKIPYLKKLGINCVEIMPVAQFPGKRNWGYDGVGLYAVQNGYGGPDGLKKLVDACHRAGLAVCMDVVYNHLGPEGNYLHGYGPYFTKKYHTPWGDALNYDDAHNGPVRRFVIDNALYWITEYHMDALRLDAVHGIFDHGKKHILQELNERVQAQARKLGRPVHVIAESDLNDSRIIRSLKQKGYGLAGQWSDDFHHAVHACLTGERSGYYEDFGRLGDIAKALRDGFVYDGKYSVFRKRQHGNSVHDLDPRKLVTCVQNHDQVGNRAFGERLSTLADFQKQKLAAVLLLLSPNTPLIFMGQEYGEKAPFQYFIDHGDPDLVRAVREGRTKEFASFGWKEIPDPDAKKTFRDSKLTWTYQGANKQGYLWRLYRDLIMLRKKMLTGNRLVGVDFNERDRWLSLRYDCSQRSDLVVVLSFLNQRQEVRLPFKKKVFKELLNTEAPQYGGQCKRVSISSETLRVPPLCAWVGR